MREVVLNHLDALRDDAFVRKFETCTDVYFKGQPEGSDDFFESYSLDKENSSPEIRRTLQMLCDIGAKIYDEEFMADNNIRAKKLRLIRKQVEILEQYIIAKHVRNHDFVEFVEQPLSDRSRPTTEY